MFESEYLKDNDELVNKLRQMPFLELFDEKSLKGALQLSKIRKYGPGETIIEESSYDNRIYFLISGNVRVEKDGKNLNTLKRGGDVFGEMGVIDGSARSATVVAVDDTACLAIDASYIDRLSGQDKIAFSYILYRVFAESLADRLRITSQELILAKKELAKLKDR